MPREGDHNSSPHGWLAEIGNIQLGSEPDDFLYVLYCGIIQAQCCEHQLLKGIAKLHQVFDHPLQRFISMLHTLSAPYEYGQAVGKLAFLNGGHHPGINRVHWR